MKIEQLIVQYLYQDKKLSLQNIGYFVLSPDVIIPSEAEKDNILPENAVQFEYDTRAPQDLELIDFIVQQTRKIKPLATSDLESFTMLGRQFMNIGKPLVLEGLGILQINQSGQYEFIQGQNVSHKMDHSHGGFREKESEEVSFSTPPRQKNGKRWILPFLLIIGILGALAYIYYRFNENKAKFAEQPVTTATVTDTVKKDSTPIVNPSPPVADTNVVVQPKRDSFSFKVVIKEYPNAVAAEKAFTKLSSYGHKLIMYQIDSTQTRIAMPFMNPLSDTSRMRDSLKIFFGGNPYIDIN
jgi:hypothetical protein